MAQGLLEFGYKAEDEMKDNVIKLGKAMYGCVQSPRAFFKELSKHLNSIGLEQSKTDPCLWYRMKNNNLVLIVASHVDDLILGGTEKEIETLKQEIKERFKIMELGRLTKHLGIWYARGRDILGDYYEMSMPKYQKEIIQDFKFLTRTKVKSQTTPGYPGVGCNLTLVLVRNSKS